MYLINRLGMRVINGSRGRVYPPLGMLYNTEALAPLVLSLYTAFCETHTHVYTLTLLLWQYRAYVSSDQGLMSVVYGVPFVPKCLTLCGNLENLAPMKRAVFMISFSFLVNKHLDLVNRCLDLVNPRLDLLNPSSIY